MLSNTTKTITIVSGLCFIVSVLIYGSFLGKVSRQKTEHFEHAEMQAEARVHKKSLQDLMQVLDETKVSRESLATRFVQDDEVINLLALIETLGKEQGVELITKSLNVVPGNEYFEFLVMKIEVTGDYERVIQILSLLEQLPYQTKIQNVQVQQKDDRIWVGLLEVQVTKFAKHEN